MIDLSSSIVTINISGSTQHVVGSFLKVFLADRRLTDKQLAVTTALVQRYVEYVSNGVIEPYASQLLFSTETRKGIYAELSMGGAHLNNTFNALCKKNILAKDESGYSINPNIVPTSKLTFNFKIHEQPRPIRDSGSKGVRPVKDSSGADNKEPVLKGEEQYNDSDYRGDNTATKLREI